MIDEYEEAVKRLLASGSPHLGELFEDMEEVDLDNPVHRQMLHTRLTSLVVDHEWIPVQLQHRFSLLELVECVEAGQQAWNIHVLDLVSDASGSILAPGHVRNMKAIVHDSGLPVDHLLWP